MAWPWARSHTVENWAVEAPLVRRVVFQHLMLLVRGYITTKDVTWRYDTSESIVVLLCAVRRLSLGNLGQLIPHEDVNESSSVLVSAYNEISRSSEAHRSGMVSMLLHSLCWLGDVTIDGPRHAVTGKYPKPSRRSRS